MKSHKAMIAVAVFVSGCAAPHVYFDKVIYDQSAKPTVTQAEGASVVRSYQDQDGSFYPQTVSSPYGQGLESGDADPVVQQSRAEKTADEIVKALRSDRESGKLRPLVILIHGFNVEDAEPSYAFARDRINDYLKGSEQPVYWQVHWDGRQIKWYRPWFAWSRAQGTGPLAGLKLRLVLDQVLKREPQTPIRILTHSSGAFVAASLLGNNSNALPLTKSPKGNYLLFVNRVENLDTTKEYSVPQSNDIRLAMLAPATPFNSFAMEDDMVMDGRKRTDLDGILTHRLRLIVGLNEADVAVTKGPLPGSADLLGSTSLGSDRESYWRLERAVRDLRTMTPPRFVEAHLVDFQYSQTYNKRSLLFWDSHDLTVYLQRQQMPQVFDLLFR